MEYLIRLLSKKDYALQLLAGQLNLYSAAHYLANYELGRGDPTECLASKTEYLNIHTPILCTVLFKTNDADDQTIRLHRNILRDFCPNGGYAVVIEKNCLIEHLVPLQKETSQKWHGPVQYDLDLDKLPNHWADLKCDPNEVIFHKTPKLSYQSEYRFVFPCATKTYYPFESSDTETPWKTSVAPFSEDLFIQKIPSPFEIEWEDDCFTFCLNDKNLVKKGDWTERNKIRTVDDANLFANPKSIPYYSKVSAVNKTGLLGLPNFLLKVKWDIPKLLRSYCSNGHMIQLREAYCDSFDCSPASAFIDRQIKSWPVRNSMIQKTRESQYDDSLSIDYCNQPKEAAKRIGTRGSFIVNKYVYWLSDDELKDSELAVALSSLASSEEQESALSWQKYSDLKKRLTSNLTLQRQLVVPYDCTYLGDIDLLPIPQLIKTANHATDFLEGLESNHHITPHFLASLKSWMMRTLNLTESSIICLKLDKISQQTLSVASTASEFN